MPNTPTPGELVVPLSAAKQLAEFLIGASLIGGLTDAAVAWPAPPAATSDDNQISVLNEVAARVEACGTDARYRRDYRAHIESECGRTLTDHEWREHCLDSAAHIVSMALAAREATHE